MSELPLIKQRYQIQEKLDETQFKSTYKAVDTETSHICVVKEIVLSSSCDPLNLEQYNKALKRLTALNHPQISNYHELFTIEDKMYLIRDYVEGKSLRTIVKDGKQFNQEQIFAIISQITTILNDLQSQSPPIVHRNITPNNLILNTNGEVYLTDFSIFQGLIVEEEEKAIFSKTEGYKAPEQLQGKSTPSSDIYSLGVTLIFALCAKEPHQIESKNSKINFRLHVNTSVDVAQILDMMVEPDSQNRQQNASELLADLNILSGKAKAPPPSIPAPNNGPQHTKLLVLMGILTVVFWMYFYTQPEPEDEYTYPSSFHATRRSKIKNIMMKVKLFYRGEPISTLTSQEPEFEFIDKRTRKKQVVEASFNEGEYVLKGLDSGAYDMQIKINANQDNAPLYPGDFNSSTVIKLRRSIVEPKEIHLHKIIHLLTPQDNNEEPQVNEEQLEGKEDCQLPDEFENQVTFGWEPVSDDAVYEYTVERYKCPFTLVKTVKKGRLHDASIKLNLPANEDNYFYRLKLLAYAQPYLIGELTTHEKKGMTSGYRFRVY